MKPRSRFVGAIVILVLASGCVGAVPSSSGVTEPSASASTPMTAPPTPSASLDLAATLKQFKTFSDWQTAARWDVFLGANGAAESSFHFFEPGFGEAQATGSFVVDSTGSGTAVSFDGPATLDSGATADPVFGAPVSSASNAPASLRFSLTLDAAGTNSQVEIWLGSSDLTASSLGNPPAADSIVASYCAALINGDWGTVYDLTIPSKLTREQFIAQIASRGDPGTFVSVVPVGSVSYSAQGYPMARVTLSVTYRSPAGATQTASTLAGFVWTSGAWRLLSTQDATASPTPSLAT